MGYIALDISTNCTGWNIIYNKKIISFGKLQIPWELKNKISLEEKALIQSKMLSKVIKKYKMFISYAIPETPFTGKNKKTGLLLAQMKGALSLILSYNNIKIEKGFAPKEVKKVVTGNGSATKEELSTEIIAFFNKTDMKALVGEFNEGKNKKNWKLKTDDVYDSFGISIANEKRKKEIANGK